MEAAQVQRKLELSPDEDFVLTAWQYRMMQRDIAASKGKHLPAKREVRNGFRTAAAAAITSRDQGGWSPAVAEVVRRISADGADPNFEALESAGPEVSAVIERRSRALLLLIDLYGFEPWAAGKWEKSARAEILGAAHGSLTPLHPEDLDAVENAYKHAIKTLSKAGNWTKYALLAGAGLGLGLLTGGLVAPAIAGAYGALVLGYSGAVATSAGLAALGGGSIAAGGLGMAGGAALITGFSGAAGAGVVTLAGRAAGLTAARIAADAVRLHVVTQLVLRDVDGNEEAAKAVIVSLRERVTNLGKTAAVLDGLSQLKKSDLLRRWERETARLPIDHTGPHFGGRTHRVKSAGHDIGRFCTALNQIRTGVFEGTFWADGQRIPEVATTTRSGVPFVHEPDPRLAIALLLKHWAADFVTPMSLPLPGWTLLRDMPDPALHRFALDAYASGLNLRSGLLTPALGVLATEVVIRTHTHLAAYRSTGTARLTSEAVAKCTEMLLAAHAASGAISLSKTAAAAITGHTAVAARNLDIPVLARIGMLALQVRSHSQSEAGAPTWDYLLAEESATWTLPEAVTITDLLAGQNSHSAAQGMKGSSSVT